MSAGGLATDQSRRESRAAAAMCGRLSRGIGESREEGGLCIAAEVAREAWGYRGGTEPPDPTVADRKRE